MKKELSIQNLHLSTSSFIEKQISQDSQNIYNEQYSDNSDIIDIIEEIETFQLQNQQLSSFTQIFQNQAEYNNDNIFEVKQKEQKHQKEEKVYRSFSTISTDAEKNIDKIQLPMKMYLQQSHQSPNKQKIILPSSAIDQQQKNLVSQKNIQISKFSKQKTQLQFPKVLSQQMFNEFKGKQREILINQQNMKVDKNIKGFFSTRNIKQKQQISDQYDLKQNQQLLNLQSHQLQQATSYESMGFRKQLKPQESSKYKNIILKLKPWGDSLAQRFSPKKRQLIILSAKKDTQI